MTATPPSERSKLILVETDDDLLLLADFIRRVWSPGIDLQTLRATRAIARSTNPAHPGQPPPTFLFLLDGRAVGHLTTIPMRLKCDAWTGAAHWLKGFWVLPEHRNGPIGTLLIREATRTLDCLMATVVETAPRRVFSAFGLKDFGALHDYVRVLRSRRVLQRLDPDALGLRLSSVRKAALRSTRYCLTALFAGALLDAAFAARRITARGSQDLCTKTDPLPGDWLDEIWARVAADLRYTPIRDAAYVQHRFGRSIGKSHRLVVLYRGSEVAAWATFRRPAQGRIDPRLGGIQIATLTDIVVPSSRPDDGIALLRATEDVARSDGADVLICSASDKTLRNWLSQRSFLPFGRRVHFTARAARNAPPLPEAVESWWLSRADGGADEGL